MLFCNFCKQKFSTARGLETHLGLSHSELRHQWTKDFDVDYNFGEVNVEITKLVSYWKKFGLDITPDVEQLQNAKRFLYLQVWYLWTQVAKSQEEKLQLKILDDKYFSSKLCLEMAEYIQSKWRPLFTKYKYSHRHPMTNEPVDLEAALLYREQSLVEIRMKTMRMPEHLL